MATHENLSLEMVIEKNLIASTAAFLVALEIEVKDPETYQAVETIRVVKNNEPIRYQGKDYGMMDFDLEVTHAAGELPKVKLSITDYTQVVQQKMQAYGGGVGFKVKLFVINSGELSSPPGVVQHYIVTDASAANYVVSWTLGADNPGQLRLPRRLQRRDMCQWRYKSTECGYKGTLPSCDLTLQGNNGCAKHKNEDNFGGFPGLKSGAN